MHGTGRNLHKKEIDLEDLLAGRYFIRILSGDRAVSPIYPIVMTGK